MARATRLSVATTTVFYMLCGCMGYAAFGDDAPDNLLTGFGFYEPFWLLDVANVAIIVHLVGAYQAGFPLPGFSIPVTKKYRRSPRNVFLGFIGKFSDSSFCFRMKFRKTPSICTGNNLDYFQTT